jgi:hypothetical protein
MIRHDVRGRLGLNLNGLPVEIQPARPPLIPIGTKVAEKDVSHSVSLNGLSCAAGDGRPGIFGQLGAQACEAVSRLSTTILSFPSSVQRRRRPVSTTSSRST